MALSHVPFEVVSVWPTRGVPEMTGCAISFGAACPRAAADAVMTATRSSPVSAAMVFCFIGSP